MMTNLWVTRSNSDIIERTSQRMMKKTTTDDYRLTSTIQTQKPQQHLLGPTTVGPMPGKNLF